MFQINLISVSKLCESLSCYVTFSNPTCMIQAMKSHQMIGLGELVNGLYKLKVQDPASPAIHSISSNSFSNSCNNVASESYIHMSALWHFRLGHLSNNRLYHMTSLYPSISCDNKSVCDICHFAKQRKLPFNVSLSHASSKFELLHFDI